MSPLPTFSGYKNFFEFDEIYVLACIIRSVQIANVKDPLAFYFRYHGSIPMSQKTILNYLMKVVAVGYGGIYISLWFTSALFNIFPNQANNSYLFYFIIEKILGK